MKKLILTSLAIVSFSSVAVFGVLQGSWIDGMNKYCKYSNGVIITIDLGSVCPVSID